VSAWRQVLELAVGEEDLRRLREIARSRTEPASHVERARMLLAYREDPSFFAVGRALGLHHQTVQRCVERAVAYGPLAALDDLPDRAKSPALRLRRVHGWWTSLVARRRSGRCGSWGATPASMGRQNGMSAWPSDGIQNPESSRQSILRTSITSCCSRSQKTNWQHYRPKIS
jgi:hypothetical protein